ncbi:MAG: 2-oxo acid dehydrogenase subunit E2 [Oscillospiraceae bacterium]|nr:2-oxo acid dehydrogenase subunit E2 [Candidatus Equicaccousia limihippi]
MATLVLMPKVGITVESCVITKWHKQKGDAVKKGDILFSYETDKASVDEEAADEGILLDIFSVEGDDVPCLTGVAVIGKEGEDYSDLIPKGDAEEAPAEEEKEEVKETAKEPEVKVESVISGEKSTDYKASPRAKNYAAKHGVDLSMVAPTGPYGRIVEADVINAVENGTVLTSAAAGLGKDAYGITGTGIGGRVTVGDLANGAAPAVAAAAEVPDVEIVPLPNIRKVIAKSMMTSLTTTAQLTNSSSFDATAIMNYRKVLKATDESLGLNKITINDIILFACSRVLKNHRSLNANLIGEEMHYFNSVNLGMAVDTERGLLVPTIFNADKMTLAEISAKSKELSAAAKSGNLSPDLMKGASFTISNLGTLGVESFTPVINPPQTGILGVCTIVDKVKMVNGEIKVYPSMGLSLTYDHRVVDGAPAGRFVQELKQVLENFTAYLAK